MQYFLGGIGDELAGMADALARRHRARRWRADAVGSGLRRHAGVAGSDLLPADGPHLGMAAAVAGAAAVAAFALPLQAQHRGGDRRGGGRRPDDRRQRRRRPPHPRGLLRAVRRPTTPRRAAPGSRHEPRPAPEGAHSRSAGSAQAAGCTSERHRRPVDDRRPGRDHDRDALVLPLLEPRPGAARMGQAGPALRAAGGAGGGGRAGNRDDAGPADRDLADARFLAALAAAGVYSVAPRHPRHDRRRHGACSSRAGSAWAGSRSRRGRPLRVQYVPASIHVHVAGFIP